MGKVFERVHIWVDTRVHVVTGRSLWLDETEHEDKHINRVMQRSRNVDG